MQAKNEKLENNMFRLKIKNKKKNNNPYMRVMMIWFQRAAIQ